jgi:hypothetical protein
MSRVGRPRDNTRLEAIIERGIRNDEEYETSTAVVVALKSRFYRADEAPFLCLPFSHPPPRILSLLSFVPNIRLGRGWGRRLESCC